MAAITGSRVTSWRLDAITPTGEVVQTLPMVKHSGEHAWLLDAEVPLTMSADLMRGIDDDPLPDLRGLWLRAWHRINGTDHMVCTAVAAAAPSRLSAVGAVVRVTGYDPTRILQRARLRAQLVLPAGAPVRAEVLSLAATYAPSVQVSVAATDATLREPLTFDLGEPALQVANELLASIAHNPLRPRVDGSLHSEPWLPPAQRGEAITFGEHVGAPFAAGVQLDDDWLSRPDEVIARTRGSASAEALVGRWPDYPVPDATVEVIDVEADTIETATMLARRHWEDRQAITREVEAEGPWQPVVPGDVARWSYDRHRLDMTAEVTGIRTRWDLPGQTTYSLRGIVS